MTIEISLALFITLIVLSCLGLLFIVGMIFIIIDFILMISDDLKRYGGRIK